MSEAIISIAPVESPARKRVSKHLGRVAMRILVPPLRMLPLGAGRSFGRGLGGLTFRLLGRYRLAALRNLELIYGSETSEKERYDMARAVFRHFGQVGAEFLKLPRLTDAVVEQLSVVNGEENLKAAMEMQSGVLLITGHFGNWEFMGRWLSLHGYPLNVVARDARDPVATKLVADTRGSNGANVLYRGNSARAVLQCLKKREIVALLPDQNAADVFVPFLGVNTGTVDGPAIIHLKTKAPLLFAWCVRRENGQFEITFDAPVVMDSTGDKAADVITVMTEINARLALDPQISNPVAVAAQSLESYSGSVRCLRTGPVRCTSAGRLHKGKQSIAANRPMVDMSAIRRVLIVKVSAMGDIIHALPVSAALKDAYPHLEISWAVEEAFVPLLDGNPCITSLVVLPKIRGKDLCNPPFYTAYFSKIREACTKGVDLSLDLQGLTKSAVIALKSGAGIRLGYHWLREGAKLLEKPVPRRPGSVHIVDQYLDVADALGAETKHVRFPFYIGEEDERIARDLLIQCGIEPGTPFVSINPASARALKQWSAERFANLMDRLFGVTGVPCVLVTADARVANETVSHAKQPIASLAGKTSLKQLAGVLKQSAVHVCGDTGSGHLAAALGRPVVSLIGPTDPDRACPYGQRENTISRHDVCGVQCDGRKCQFERPRCMDAIQVDDVAQKAMSVMCLK